MNILIAGATGLIGKQLVDKLSANHQFTVLSRDTAHVKKAFGEKIKGVTWDQLDSLDASQFDAVINLSGHNIAASRWSEQTKQLIIDSRVNTNAMLINWLIKAHAKPHYFSANAVGIYGAQDKDDNQALNEASPVQFEKPKDFLNEVGLLWQQSVQPAIDVGIPVTVTRFGVVLKRGDGMLGKLVPSFKFGLGSVIGDGEQIISWVEVDDVVSAYDFLLNHPELIGPVNVTSPNPVNQKTFAKTLAKTLNRPLLFKTPTFVIRLLFGEMGEYLINRGQRVVPKRLLEAGFSFQHPDLEASLDKELQSTSPSS